MPDGSRDSIAQPLSGRERTRARIELGVGAILVALCMAVILVIADKLGPSERPFRDLESLDLILIDLFAVVIALIGMVQFVGAILKLFPPWPRGRLGAIMPALGYRTFVAWRYLLVWPIRVRGLVGVFFVAALVVRGLCWWIAIKVLGHDPAMFARMGTSGLATPLWIVEQLASWFWVAVVYVGMVRHSKPATWVVLIAWAVAILCYVAMDLIIKDRIPFLDLQVEDMGWLLEGLYWGMLIFAVIAGVAFLVGMIRSLFTFFTTVPIVGVCIGTMALVIVLSVMGGFESDLRHKILGSNAHVQITRETGEFTGWREVKAKIDKIPGIVASTPYATSEVVIAANNNGMNVIIKGIDPATVGKVTDLVNDIEDPDKAEVMKRLAPIVDDNHDLRVPQKPKPANKPTVDPPPDDMPQPGDPIDFSGPSSGSGDSGGSGDPPYGGDARPLLDIPDPQPTSGAIIDDRPPPAPPRRSLPSAVDPPPADLLTTDEPPADYSVPDAELPIHVVDAPLDPTMSRRTQSLPGVLVGKELVKQTHLYTGEEVRVVSPLSDPSNPDATGTPIPFNRDYRVAGVFYTGMYEYDLKYVYVSLESLQEFLDRGDAVDGIEIRLDNPDDTATAIDRITDELGPNYRVQDWKELNRSLFSALKLEKYAMFLVLGIVILVASFAIIGNLIMVVDGKRNEIGLLKTLGAADLEVVQLFAIQGLMIGLIGTFIGVWLGLAGCLAGQGGVPLNPDVYYIDKLPIHIEWGSVVAAALAGILVSVVATIYPAFRSALVRPAEALREH